MGFRWPGFRKVRGQVCKRIRRRMRALGLDDFAAYQAYLEADADEWRHLDGLCRITISRFFRDRGVFEDLAATVLPALAKTASADDRPLAVWSAGCASGEEPYSIKLLWRLRMAATWPRLAIAITATDSDQAMLARAETGCYEAGSLKELPQGWRDRAFEQSGGHWCLRPEFKHGIRWLAQDIRIEAPDGPFDLVLCRNLAFTYFDSDTQHAVLARIAHVTRNGGALVLGAHESVPAVTEGFVPWPGARHIWRRTIG
jgi:chemotaxis protein methyltransferase CheR